MYYSCDQLKKNGRLIERENNESHSEVDFVAQSQLIIPQKIQIFLLCARSNSQLYILGSPI